jgi:hypothetical protein
MIFIDVLKIASLMIIYIKNWTNFSVICYVLFFINQIKYRDINFILYISTKHNPVFLFLFRLIPFILAIFVVFNHEIVIECYFSKKKNLFFIVNTSKAPRFWMTLSWLKWSICNKMVCGNWRMPVNAQCPDT